MLLLLLGFAIIHSGGAALRLWGEQRLGNRLWRLIFVGASLPMAVLLVAYFLTHRYDGLRLWNLQGAPGLATAVWGLTALSFLFLYPATFHLLEIPALLKPRMRLYATGILRISRHPQMVGQLLWCFTHTLWLGTSFALVTSLGLMAHHLFAVWHGDRRLQQRFGKAFEEMRRTTSVIPFQAVLDGRQKLVLSEFLRPAYGGILLAVALFWWSHRWIGAATSAFSATPLNHLLS
ncbi:NnrU family protein [Candidatus Synechococcus spongiarum]|uniref:NnrU family protein n=1 Tax=Candidatus Synechococcus spongiarum TaxID=431041 RepID=UPI00046FDA31|nr:NnrU family protein [Candidatus Synechococcus spongiarum]